MMLPGIMQQWTMVMKIPFASGYRPVDDDEASCCINTIKLARHDFADELLVVAVVVVVVVVFLLVVDVRVIFRCSLPIGISVA